jgi:hypothetical protein
MKRELKKYNLLMDDGYFWLCMIVVTLLVIVIQGVLYYQGFYSISADESGRTLLAHQWSVGELKEMPIWLPFYTIVVGTFLNIFPDLFWVPRIIATVFGVLSFLSIVWLSHEFFKNKIITILTALLTLFFWPRVILTAVPLSESMYFALIASGCALFARWLLNSGSGWVLFLSAVLFSFATTVRYEGWVFAFSFVCVVFVQVYVVNKNVLRVQRTHMWLSFLLLCIFPAYWIIMHAYVNGDPFGFISGTVDRYLLLHGAVLDKVVKNSLPIQFLAQNTMTLNIIGIFSIAYLWVTYRSIQIWIVLFTISLSIMSIISLSGKGMPSYGFWRIPAVWSMLLIPFTSHFILKVGELIGIYRQPMKWTFIVLVVFVFVGVSSQRVYTVSQNSYFSMHDLAAGRYMQGIIKDNPRAKVLIDTSDWSFLNVKVASQNPGSFDHNSGKDPMIPENSKLTIYNKERLVNDLLLFKNEEYKRFIKNHLHAKELTTFGQWSVFQLK